LVKALEMPNETNAQIFRRAAQHQVENGLMKNQCYDSEAKEKGPICALASVALAISSSLKGIVLYGTDYECNEGKKLQELDTIFLRVIGKDLCHFNNDFDTTSESLSFALDRVAKYLEDEQNNRTIQ
jgi:hypothetical protein